MWGSVGTGPTALTSVNFYTGFSGPTSFGPGSGAVPDSGTGDQVAIHGDVSVGLLVVPSSYVSDTALSSTSTFDKATIASLGATPGTLSCSDVGARTPHARTAARSALKP